MSRTTIVPVKETECLEFVFSKLRQNETYTCIQYKYKAAPPAGVPSKSFTSFVAVDYDSLILSNLQQCLDVMECCQYSPHMRQLKGVLLRLTQRFFFERKQYAQVVKATSLLADVEGNNLQIDTETDQLLDASLDSIKKGLNSPASEVSEAAAERELVYHLAKIPFLKVSMQNHVGLLQALGEKSDKVRKDIIKHLQQQSQTNPNASAKQLASKALEVIQASQKQPVSSTIGLSTPSKSIPVQTAGAPSTPAPPSPVPTTAAPETSAKAVASTAASTVTATAAATATAPSTTATVTPSESIAPLLAMDNTAPEQQGATPSTPVKPAAPATAPTTEGLDPNEAQQGGCVVS